jgi:hypothetical protein
MPNSARVLNEDEDLAVKSRAVLSALLGVLGTLETPQEGATPVHASMVSSSLLRELADSLDSSASRDLKKPTGTKLPLKK